MYLNLMFPVLKHKGHYVQNTTGLVGRPTQTGTAQSSGYWAQFDPPGGGQKVNQRCARNHFLKEFSTFLEAYCISQLTTHVGTLVHSAGAHQQASCMAWYPPLLPRPGRVRSIDKLIGCLIIWKEERKNWTIKCRPVDDYEKQLLASVPL